MPMLWLPSSKRLHYYGKSPFWMGQLTISMAILNSYVKLPPGILLCHGIGYTNQPSFHLARLAQEKMAIWDMWTPFLRLL